MEELEQSAEVQNKEPFSAIYSSPSHALTVQHSEKDADGERKEYEFKFHHGVLRFDDEEEHERFLRALKNVHVSVRNLVRRQDLVTAEQIARAHADRMRAENRAIAGPFTADLAAQQSSEAREAQFVSQAGSGAGKVTPGALRSLFQSGKSLVGGGDNK